MVREIEERAFNAWPALETRVICGWLMRFSAGYTKRANSVNAWRPEGPLAHILPHATSLYRSRSLPLIVRLSPLADADADALLEARGFSRIDETIVMTASLNESNAALDSAVTTASTPTSEWLAGFATANGVPDERRKVHDSMVANIAAPVAFARLATTGPPVAWGIAVIERDFVGLFDIVTAPSARRQGVGRRLIRHMLHWAKTHGATSAYLQVVAANTSALALYRQLGFREAYRYHYRIAPQ
ncbi:MAG: GNAT family N-acetyltransferase [Hyphomicrobiaceae bacterium]